MVALGMGLVGCGEAAPDPWAQFDEFRSLSDPFGDHLRIVESDLSARNFADVPLVETLRVGTREGGGATAFGSITAMEIDSLGRILVLDGQAQHIVVLSPTGDFIRVVGQRGEGPDEFASAFGMALGPGDSIWVADTRNQRISVAVADSASPIRTMPRPRAGITFPWAARWVSGAGLVEIEYQPLLAPHPANPSFGQVQGPVRALVPKVVGGGEAYPAVQRYSQMVQSSVFRRPFDGGLNAMLNSDGTFWFGKTERYEIAKRTLAGDTTLVVRVVGLEPLPIPSSVVDSALATIRDNTIDVPSLNRDDVAPHYPVVERFFEGDDSRLYVFPTMPSDDELQVVDIFDASSGEYLESLRMPAAIERNPRPIVRDGHLYGVTVDDFDVQYIVRIRIRDSEP